MGVNVTAAQRHGCSVLALYEKPWVVSPLVFMAQSWRDTQHICDWSCMSTTQLYFAAFLHLESKTQELRSWLEKESENKHKKYCPGARDSHLQQPTDDEATSGSNSEAEKGTGPSSDPSFCNMWFRCLKKQRKIQELWMQTNMCHVPCQDNGGRAE